VSAVTHGRQLLPEPFPEPGGEDLRRNAPREGEFYMKNPERIGGKRPYAAPVEPYFMPASSFSADTLSVASHENSGSSRPK